MSFTLSHTYNFETHRAYWFEDFPGREGFVARPNDDSKWPGVYFRDALTFEAVVQEIEDRARQGHCGVEEIIRLWPAELNPYLQWPHEAEMIGRELRDAQKRGQRNPIEAFVLNLATALIKPSQPAINGFGNS